MKQNWFGVVTIVSAFGLGVVTTWAYQNFDVLPGVALEWPASARSASQPEQPSPAPIAQTPAPVAPAFPAPPATPAAPVNPMLQIERMRQQMDQMFGATDPRDLFGRNDLPAFGSLFDKNFSGSTTGALTFSEDDKSVTYSLDIPKEDLVDLNVNVKDGYLSVDATLKRESQGARYQSQLSQRVPVPLSVDPNSLNVESGTDAVVIHLDKQNA
ncbi:MAG: Hsp20/alpha crystallin family protein [Pseudomonadota bacterium]